MKGVISLPLSHLGDATGPFVIMGVSGCGKSTVASLLARACGGVFLDADDFHPPENKIKMAAGIPLTDENRKGWLITLNVELCSRIAVEKIVFLACSALKESYRSIISQSLPGLIFIYLRGTKEFIRSRLESRKEHFMPIALLDSQFTALEEPTHAIIEDAALPAEHIVANVLKKLKLLKMSSNSETGYKP